MGYQEKRGSYLTGDVDSICLVLGFSAAVTTPPSGHLTTAGDIFVCHK